jgi:hypothetical protein
MEASASALGGLQTKEVAVSYLSSVKRIDHLLLEQQSLGGQLCKQVRTGVEAQHY